MAINWVGLGTIIRREMLRLMRVYDAAMTSAETGQVVTLNI